MFTNFAKPQLRQYALHCGWGDRLNAWFWLHRNLRRVSACMSPRFPCIRVPDLYAYDSRENTPRRLPHASPVFTRTSTWVCVRAWCCRLPPWTAASWRRIKPAVKSLEMRRVGRFLTIINTSSLPQYRFITNAHALRRFCRALVYES